MKIKLLLFLLVVSLSGCIKDLLDRKPLNLVSDADIWKSSQLVDLYLVALYDNLPIGLVRGGSIFEFHYTDEASHPYAGVAIVGDYGNQALALNTGMYSWIRKANYFLQMIPTSSLPANDIKMLTAECRFIRAYYYFDLVKKYGGMPIINEVQTFNGNLEELRVPRNKEEEVYQFILAELNAAYADLPDARAAGQSNRATKWTALALKSRAMLYAGSIAKYGSVQLNGLVGIPAEKAIQYFNEAADASKQLIDGNKFSLYTKSYDPASKSGDPAANYAGIFIDKSNAEIIFQKAYSDPNKTHSWDTYILPQSFKPACCGNAGSVTLEMAESYEYTDGSQGELKYENKVFNTPEELFKNKDPRFAATISRSESPFIGRNVQIYRGIISSNGTVYDAPGADYPLDPARKQVGLDGPAPLGDVGKTGFYLRKYINTAGGIVADGKSSQNYIDIRYAEILLNYAEALFESNGDKAAALTAINQVRNRAGIALLNSAGLTIDKIRNERKVELAFEDKRFWDIRRWRIGTNLFRNTRMHGLWPYLKQEGNIYKYTFKSHEGAPIDNGLTRLFQERDYYSNLSGYISSNLNIQNNPGW